MRKNYLLVALFAILSLIIAKTKRTTFQNETYNFLIFSHLALQSFERRLTTVLVAIKRLLSLH